jgi:hypothetical protein
MGKTFEDLLMNDKDITPLDSVMLYEEFRDLTPTGDAGDKLVQRVAERLVEADLLDRATGVLQHEVDDRLQGLDKAKAAERLGAIYLLDKTPRPALDVLDKAKEIYTANLTGDEQAKKTHEVDLLRARALSQMNHTEEALQMLSKMTPGPDVNRLRADIAWQARMWEDAAEALQDLIADESPDLTQPLTPKQADLILNRAVALNLSGNRVELASVRTRYYDAMKKTPRARLFDVVTRPRQTSILADRQTIESIVSEVDMFKDFLEAYKKEEASKPASAAAAPAAAPAQTPPAK